MDYWRGQMGQEREGYQFPGHEANEDDVQKAGWQWFGGFAERKQNQFVLPSEIHRVSWQNHAPGAEEVVDDSIQEVFYSCLADLPTKGCCVRRP